MRTFTKDEIFEAFIIHFSDFVPFAKALSVIANREVTQEEWESVLHKIDGMRKGFVQRNINIRNIGKENK